MRARSSERAPKRLLGLLEARLPLVLELVARGVRVGVARAPEAVDEGVALVVLVERQERLALLLAEQQADLLEPLLVLGRQLGDAAPCRGRAGPGRRPAARAARGRRAGRARQARRANGRRVRVIGSILGGGAAANGSFLDPNPGAGAHSAGRVRMRPWRRYFDHNATTPLDPRVLVAMLPWLGEHHGNASSAHAFGRHVRGAVEIAREQVAAAIGARAARAASSPPRAPRPTTPSSSRSRATPASVASWSSRRSSTRRCARGRALRRGRHDGARRSPPEPDGVVAADGGARGAGPRDPAGRPDARQQRGGNPAAGRGGRRRLPRARRAGALRRRAGGRQGAGRRRSPGSRLPHPRRPQVPRPARRRGALDPPGARRSRPFLVGGSQERRRGAPARSTCRRSSASARRARWPAASSAERRRHLAILRDRFESGVAEIPGGVVHCTGAPRLPHTSHVAFRGVEGESSGDPPRPRRLRGLDRLGLPLGHGRAERRCSPPWGWRQRRRWARCGSPSA